MSLEYWFAFPVAVAIASIAMASGIGGATFFSPFFLLILGLAPEVAIGTGLITEVFGFASGVTAYLRKRLIDFRLAGSLLSGAIPLAILGTWLSPRLDPTLLQMALGVGLAGIAVSLVRAPAEVDVRRRDLAIAAAAGRPREMHLIDADGRSFRYTCEAKTGAKLLSAVGGLFVGLISTGLGELNGYFLLQRCRVPSAVAVATSVLVVAVTALSAASLHLLRFVRTGGDVLDTILSIVVFTIPGVIIGAQIGARVGSRIEQRTLERGLAILFGVVAATTLFEAAT
jgi:uncharacterized membrane protein YfcA